MKRILFVLFVSSLTAVSLQSKAQADGKQWSIGFGPQGGLPVGDAKQAFNVNGGLAVRFS